MEDKIIKIVNEIIATRMKQVEREMKVSMVEEMKKRVALLIKDSSESFSDAEIKGINNLLITGLDKTEIKFSAFKIDETKFNEVKKDLELEINKAKQEAIPEELKLFVDEKGVVKEDVLNKINNAILVEEKREEFNNFKKTEFIKNLGEEGVEITQEKLEELKELISTKKFNGIMDGSIKKIPFVDKLFIKEEEEEVIDETDDKKVIGFESIFVDSKESEQANEEIEELVKEFVDNKKTSLLNKELPTDQFKNENGEIVTMEQYTESVRENIKNNFAKKIMNQK